MAIPKDSQGKLLTRDKAIGALLDYFQKSDPGEAKKALNEAFDTGKGDTRKINNLLIQNGGGDYQRQQIQNAINTISPFEKDPKAAIDAELKNIRMQDYSGLSDSDLENTQKQLQFFAGLGPVAANRTVGVNTAIGGPNNGEETPASYDDVINGRKSQFVSLLSPYAGNEGATDIANRIAQGQINNAQDLKTYLSSRSNQQGSGSGGFGTDWRDFTLVGRNLPGDNGGSSENPIDKIIRLAGNDENFRTLQGRDISGLGGNFNGADLGTDLNAIEGLISSRGKQASSQKQIDDLVASLPQELARNRGDLFNTLGQQGQQYFGDVLAPQIVQGLNARGLLNSGDLESELARGAGDVQGSYESALMDQQAQDDAFFQNAAYQQTFQKEIQSGTDLSSQVQYSRGQAMQNQQQSFQGIQANLNRQYQSLLQQRQNQASLNNQRAQYDQQQAQAAQQSQNSLLNSLGQSVGAVGGAVVGNYLGGPLGGAIGSQAGQSIGGGVTSR